jgi:LysR family transcriptional regulator, low CO2-responsive transcriptional regulator
VGGAARALHVTQPTASTQLREIAETVGLPLHELVGRRIRLTETGEALARTARAMMGEWEAFEQQLAGWHGLTRGRLRVAVVSTAKYFMPRLLGSFCRQHPQIDIALEVLNRDGVLARLREHRDDLYVMSQPPPDLALDDTVLMPNPLCLIAAANDSRANGEALPLSALQDEPFVLREPGSGTRMAVDAAFRAQRFRPRLRLELGSNEAIREAVAGGLGLGVVSAHSLAAKPQTQGVCLLPVQGFPLRSQWHLVHPRGQLLSPLARAFREHLLTQAPRTRRLPTIHA